ncbi:hypothetical protein EDWATA_02339 [Edwardsiella tarda ATCC 23685]|uniref:Uncharacterized protein n=1 Tax=Edwardsiella tarda ATCC 23685 TaxID=500638 RepID=D4F6F8_EDWTA|nr:hypothetical protein EDWATA_02339 [Edwardsiella tarda ATCC 23685]
MLITLINIGNSVNENYLTLCGVRDLAVRHGGLACPCDARQCALIGRLLPPMTWAAL